MICIHLHMHCIGFALDLHVICIVLQQSRLWTLCRFLQFREPFATFAAMHAGKKLSKAKEGMKQEKKQEMKHEQEKKPVACLKRKEGPVRISSSRTGKPAEIALEEKAKEDENMFVKCWNNIEETDMKKVDKCVLQAALSTRQHGNLKDYLKYQKYLSLALEDPEAEEETFAETQLQEAAHSDAKHMLEIVKSYKQEETGASSSSSSSK